MENDQKFIVLFTVENLEFMINHCVGKLIQPYPWCHSLVGVTIIHFKCGFRNFDIKI